eukprot:EG_transcript_12236
MVEFTDEKGHTFTQFRCSRGYLAAPSHMGPVAVLPTGDSLLTVWRVLPKDEAPALYGRAIPRWPPSAVSLAIRMSDSMTGFITAASELTPRDLHTAGDQTPALEFPSSESSPPRGEDPPEAPSPASDAEQAVTEEECSGEDTAAEVPSGVGVGDPCPAAPNGPTVSGCSASGTEAERLQILRTSVVSDACEDLIVSPHQPGAVEQFQVVEGVQQQETLHFRVQAPIVNLRRRLTTYKMSIQVDQREEPMGSFEALEAEQSFTFPLNTVPTGFFVRGSYRQQVEFLDDAGPCCLPLEKQFSIVRRR